jgi:tannase
MLKLLYSNTSGTWGVNLSGLGGEWVARFLELQDTNNLSGFENVTYDTLKAWMIQSSAIYADSLQTTNPDLTPFHDAGGKVIHFHGESDFSIPTASSVRYYESVRSIMYPNMTFNASTEALNDWYRLYLVPGAGHCGPSTTQPNGPWPQNSLSQLIDWVENGVEPVVLNGTVLQGTNIGTKQPICGWPTRPLWTGNGTMMECVYDQKSIDTWIYDFDGVPTPVY